MKKLITITAALLALIGCTKNNPEDQKGKEDDKPITTFYVSYEGSGDYSGKNAQNALDVTSFIAKVKNVEDSVMTIKRADSLSGKTFIFADGTYLIDTLYIAFNDYGKPVGITFVGGNNTIFTTSGANRCLNFGSFASPTFKSITFSNCGKGTSDNGGAMYIGGGQDGIASAKFEKCSFVNNSTNESASGGSIAVGRATVELEECSFSGNDTYARNGGALYTSKEDSRVTAKKCTFSTRSYNTGGAANNSNGEQTYVDCTFDGCLTKKGTGGALHANGTSCTLIVKNCTFKNCESMHESPYTTTDSKACGGAISAQDAVVTIDNSTFDGCMGQRAGVILLQAGASATPNNTAFLKVNNCLFKDNKCSSRGIIQINGKSVAYFNACTFLNNTFSYGSWSSIIHGGNPSVICFNNCTFGAHVYSTTPTNSATINNDGFLIAAGTTIVNTDVSATIRNNHGTAELSCVLVSDILINTNTANNSLSGNKGYINSYNSIISQTGSPAVHTSSKDLLNATEDSLPGHAWNEGKYIWNGPESTFEKISPADFETAIKSLAIESENIHAAGAIGTNFYNWLTSIGAVGVDAYGTSRGTAYWPGAYQKNI